MYERVCVFLCVYVCLCKYVAKRREIPHNETKSQTKVQIEKIIKFYSNIKFVNVNENIMGLSGRNAKKIAQAFVNIWRS